MSFMSWFIRLPRYGLPIAALNRNGIDIERRPRLRGLIERGVEIASVIEAWLEGAILEEAPLRAKRFRILVKRLRPPAAHEYPHVPRGTPLLESGDEG